MPSIVTTGTTGANIHLLAKDVGELAYELVRFRAVYTPPITKTGTGSCSGGPFSTMTYPCPRRWRKQIGISGQAGQKTGQLVQLTPIGTLELW